MFMPLCRLLRRASLFVKPTKILKLTMLDDLTVQRALSRLEGG
mgnify:CR=1 FL=1